MKRLILKRPKAERDIEECFVYIGTENLDAALRFILSIEESFELLATNSEIGVLSEIASSKYFGLRMWPIRGFDKYEIFYLQNKTSIDVVRVLHSARDLKSLFEDR